MQDVLIALETDLASGIAIRYACQLEKSIRFNMQAIHVPDMTEQGHSHGAGWVHQTWENGVIQEARDQISKLVKEDLFYCYLTQSPKIIPGEKELVILKEMQQKNYGFLIEGLLHSFEPNRFFQKIDSRLYKSLSCPVLMVKNLIDLDRGVQIVGTPETIPSILPWFFQLLSDLPVAPDILVCQFDISVKKICFPDNDNHLISEIENLFSKQGNLPKKIRTAKGSPEDLALLTRNHALSMCTFPQRHSDMAMMMSISPCPIMFCPEFKTD